MGPNFKLAKVLEILKMILPDTLNSSDSQSLLRGPKVVRVTCRSGPRIPIQINNLCFGDHQIILSGPRIGKVWGPLGYSVRKRKWEYSLKLDLSIKSTRHIK